MNDSLLSRFEATEAKVSKKRYVVKLSAGERKRLEELIRKGKSPAKKQLKARILLRADESPLGPKWNDPKISEALGTYSMMCARVRQQFAQGGIDAVLNRKQRAAPPVPRIFDGEKEARLIALACSQPPEGRAKWTLRLLETQVVELKIVDPASDHTIGRVLKKMSSSLISCSNGSFRRKQAAHS
jgi:Homeodomain-like domain